MSIVRNDNACALYIQWFKELEGAGRDKSCNELSTKCSEINCVPVRGNIWLELKNVICLTRYIDNNHFIDIYTGCFFFHFERVESKGKIMSSLTEHSTRWLLFNFLFISPRSSCGNTFVRRR